MTNTKTREPLFHITRRASLPIWKKIVIYAIAVLGSLLLCCLICGLFAKKNPFMAFSSLFKGAFLTSRRVGTLFRDTALLMMVSLAVVSCFKMRFWNLGANGQILMSCLATTACMYYLGGKISNTGLNLIMLLFAVVFGVIWSVIPAIFKAYFGTNESLFTLMMNYIAAGLVNFCVNEWAKDGSAVLNPLSEGHLPVIGNDYMLIIIVSVVVTALMVVYFKFNKHGYEMSVVGESENTAKYIGINIRKVTIRTLVLSGAICGLVGLLISGAINFTVNDAMHSDMGFTAIMTAWLAKFNPYVMIATCFFVMFLTKGMVQVKMDFDFTDSAISSVALGIVYFCIIACDFFVNYQVKFKKNIFTKGNNLPKEEAKQ